MSDATNNVSTEDVTAWATDCMDEAIRTVTATGIFEGITVESKVVWALPKKIMIGRLRDTGGDHREFWVIAGEVPIDCIDATTCATVRDAARHFALKWQLGAQQIRDPKVREDRGLKQELDWEKASNELAATAEELYAIADEDQAWSDPATSGAGEN